MKILLLNCWLVLLTTTLFGQWLGDEGYTMNFEDTSVMNHLRIDTLTNQNNLWQVGSPQKTLFTGAFSAPNAIVTDTLHPYPANDTSSFIIANVATGYGWLLNHTALLQGEYFVDTDTLSDFGTIEFSPNNGTSWYDIINDTFITNHLFTAPGWATLSGSSNGWQQFYINLAPLGQLFNILLYDTILFRFTFISDSIQTNKDGLMFDNLHFEDYFEGVHEIQNDNLISISPNPTSGELRIFKPKTDGKKKIQILNHTGQTLYTNTNFNEETIDISEFPNGMYLLRFSDSKYFAIKKFVVHH
ncbi:MAG: T9SS type A sorting domain-containing protein [Bacteroidetes bacterium]|nr:T9SS type A sorting domain-containing protein [Bacteroidota bacterium]